MTVNKYILYTVFQMYEFYIFKLLQQTWSVALTKSDSIKLTY